MVHVTGKNHALHKICVLLAMTSAAEGASGRQLSYPQITGYEPGSDVQTQARIDLDQKEMEEHLARSDFEAAKAIYTLGGNSGPVAVIAIPALGAAAAYRLQVRQGSFAIGNLDAQAASGAMVIRVNYATTCRDGGLATKDTSGCFRVGGGAITISGTNVGEPTSVSNTYMTLQSFSVEGQREMGGWQWQQFFSVYRAYYNAGAYANDRVMAALDQTGMCRTCDSVARSEIAKKTSAYMNVWMYVIAKMEEAITNCRHGCANCEVELDLSGATLRGTSEHAWDEAVAYYSGSLEGVDGTFPGKMLYELAQKRCANFGTCTARNGGAAINEAVMDQFRLGQINVLQGKCVEAIAVKRRIVELMSVPLVQGALRYAYKANKIPGEDGSKEKAEGAAFSAAILPRIAACNSDAAQVISDNMNYDSSAYMSAGYVRVKEAFESTYDCLGITCEDVGGIVKDDGYYELAEPCSAPSESLASEEDTGDGLDVIVMIIIIVICVLLLMTTGIAIACCIRANKYQRMTEGKGGFGAAGTAMGQKAEA